MTLMKYKVCFCHTFFFSFFFYLVCNLLFIIIIGSPTLTINHSQYFQEANIRAQVPFLHHHVVEFDCNAQAYTIDGHDITLRIPKGAVEEGKTFHVEIGVAMYGPFHLPENTQPISPVAWVCLLEANIKLEKPFQLIIPHFLTQLSKERLAYHDVRFAKAGHNDLCSDNKVYTFHDCDTKPLFTSTGHRSYGVLISKHFCFYCLKANRTPELAVDAGYSLVRIENFLTNRRNEVFFCAIYLLESCLRVG